jgi:hypothetical protein
MRTSFIITTNSATVEQQNAITEFVRARSWGFSHYFSDMWLVLTPSNEPSAYELWKQLNDIPQLASQFMLVVKLGQPVTYFGYGPNDMWSWMVQENWASPSAPT